MATDPLRDYVAGLTSAEPVDADEFYRRDAAGNASERSTWAQIKTALASVFQPLDAVLTATTASFTTAKDSKLTGIEAGAEVNTVDSVNAATGAVVLDPDDLDDTATAHKFTSTGDISKLAGIEANADVTDTANVTSAGALMDSEVDADIKTLALPANTTISTYGASLVDDADAAAARTTLELGTAATTAATDYATAAQGSTADAAIPETIVDAKGDIVAATAADTVARLAVGANDTVLTADSSTATGLKWAAAAGGGGENFRVTNGLGIPNAIPISGGSTSALAKDRFWGSTVFSPATNITVDRIAARLTVAGEASSVMRLGVFSLSGLDSGSTATPVLDSGEIAIDTTGVLTVTGLSASLTAGNLYICALVHNSTTNPTFVWRGFAPGFGGPWNSFDQQVGTFADAGGYTFAALAATSVNFAGETAGNPMKNYVSIGWTET